MMLSSNERVGPVRNMNLAFEGVNLNKVALEDLRLTDVKVEKMKDK